MPHLQLATKKILASVKQLINLLVRRKTITSFINYIYLFILNKNLRILCVFLQLNIVCLRGISYIF